MSRSERERYEAAVAVLRSVEGGAVTERDHATPGLDPFRAATLEMDVQASEAKEAAMRLLSLSLELQATLTIMPLQYSARLSLTTSRALTPEESAGMWATRPVPQPGVQRA